MIPFLICSLIVGYVSAMLNNATENPVPATLNPDNRESTQSMLMALSADDGIARSPILPRLELGAYEALWLEDGATFKTIAERFATDPAAMPSDFVPQSVAQQTASRVFNKLKNEGVDRFGVRLHHAGDYPVKIRDAKHPVEMLYYRGLWELAETPSVAVVGSRAASDDGVARARKLARELVAAGFTVVSGLASGIDRAAHTAAIEAGGRTIAVVGTPLGQIYPKENADLQEFIAKKHLLISQVPVLRYANQRPQHNRFFFPERNATMSALTAATIIVEAGETSGTLTQARAAMHQGRKLYILDSCFKRPELTWPSRFAALGAIRVRTPDDIWSTLI